MMENDKQLIDVTKKWLSSNFEMKDMGEASYVLGVKILRDRSKRLLGLSQETYIKKMLQRYHMHDCKPMDTPIERNLSLSLDMCPKSPEEKEQMFKVPYSSAIASLMYTMMCTRPNICYVCETPFPGGPLTTRQPAEYSWMPGNSTPLMKIEQSLLCTGSSTQDIQPVSTFYTDHTRSTYG